MQRHQFHLVDSSSWPYICSLGAMIFLINLVNYIQGYNYSGIFFLSGLSMLIVCMLGWFKDIIREGSYLGDHKQVVQKGLNLGFILFVVSEFMIFFSLFWAYAHYSLSVSVELGGVWPPVNTIALSSFGVPLFNTLLLLWSGLALTIAHISIRFYDKESTLIFLGLTIVLGFFFICLQGFEYFSAPFNITDGVYGSIFFGLTGLHGLHVIIGVILLITCYFRIYVGQINKNKHLGFDFAAWYWHFVDVIWIFVFFLFIYGVDD